MYSRREERLIFLFVPWDRGGFDFLVSCGRDDDGEDSSGGSDGGSSEYGSLIVLRPP